MSAPSLLFPILVAACGAAPEPSTARDASERQTDWRCEARGRLSSGELFTHDAVARTRFEAESLALFGCRAAATACVTFSCSEVPP